MREILHLDTVDSTSNYIKRNLASLPDGFAVLAHEQTSGRGRLGRCFHSAGGGMYLSTLIRVGLPAADCSFITPAAAVAARRAVGAFGVAAAIKWVNDLLVSGKKLCGILVEPVLTGGVCERAVVGVGINLTEIVFPPELSEICTSFALLGMPPPTPLTLAERLLDELDAALALPRTALHSEYAAHCVTLGQRIDDGIAIAIDTDFALLIRRQGGEVARKTTVG